MSLSFPPAPTNGQQYQNWTWNSSVGAWVPNYAAGFVTSFNGRAGPVSFLTGDNTVGNRILLMSSVVALATPVAFANMFYNFTNLYDEYAVDIYDFQPATDGGVLILRCSTDGSTFDTTAVYDHAVFSVVGGATPTTGFTGGTPSTGCWLGGGTLGASTSPQYNSYYRMSFAIPWTTDRRKFFMVSSVTIGGTAAAPSTSRNMTVGQYSPVAPLKGLQFAVSNGNIARGVFNLYGIPKAGAGGS